MKPITSLIALLLCIACLCSCGIGSGMDTLTAHQPDAATSSASDSPTPETAYVLNTSTKKFHYPHCPSVKQMADKNRQETTAAREEILAMGYDSCGRCNP